MSLLRLTFQGHTRRERPFNLPYVLDSPAGRSGVSSNSDTTEPAQDARSRSVHGAGHVVAATCPVPSSLHPFDPLHPPGRRLERIGEEERLADDLASAELHDANSWTGCSS